MKILIATFVVWALITGSAVAAPRPPAFEQPFSVTMMIGDSEQVVATNGSLDAVARCVAEGVQTRLQIVMRSTVNGWGTTWAGSDLPAGEVVFGQITNEFPEFASGAGANFIALSPDGSLLAFGRDVFAGGVNVFGWDCIAAGVVTAFTVPLVP